MFGEGGLAGRHRLRQQKLNINSGAPVWPPSSVFALGHGGDREPWSTRAGRGFSLSLGTVTDLSVSVLMAEVVKAILCEKALFKQLPRCNRSLCVPRCGIYFALSYSIRWLLVPCSISFALPFSRSYPLQDAIPHRRCKCRHNVLDWCVCGQKVHGRRFFPWLCFNGNLLGSLKEHHFAPFALRHKQFLVFRRHLISSRSSTNHPQDVGF